MISFNDIKRIHLELSSECNANCPQCPRNFNGYPMNLGYVERSITLEEIKKIFPINFLKQLSDISINGNFGDFVMNPESLEIIKYFRENGDNDLRITISTNGGARNRNFWEALAKLNLKIRFCLDGLEDTHHLYRQNTLFSTVINNAKNYIKSGGYAEWKMIKFDHNQHQIEQCEKLSKKIGFKGFIVVDHGRNTGPVYDKDKNIKFFLGKQDPNQSYDFKTVSDHLNKNDNYDFTKFNYLKSNKVRCCVKKYQEIYISSLGDVFPCCFMGFPDYESETYGFYAYVNKQLSEIIRENSALTYGIEHAIKWFNQIEERWKIENFQDGRLIICDRSCGSKSLLGNDIQLKSS
jgi:MoaA/NifB/PqqE/SkfB family radical SAM enzyme